MTLCVFTTLTGPKAYLAAGRALYRSLGFQERDTHSFRLDLAATLAAK